MLETVATDAVKHLYLEPSRSVSLKVHLGRLPETETKQAGIAAFGGELKALQP